MGRQRVHRRAAAAGRAGLNERFADAHRILHEAVASRAFPAACVEVGDATAPLWQASVGRLTFDADAPAAAADTIFDLASLTKVIATTPLVMQQVERGVIALDDGVSRHIAEWQGADRAGVTVRDLLAHTSGLPGGWVKLFLSHRGRAEFLQAICMMPLEYSPRSVSVYSDLDFMLLGFMLDDETPLWARFTTLLGQMGIVQELQFTPPSLWHRRIAPTGHDPWRNRMLIGEVHDENAAALGGVAGHAGLFGTAASVGDYARHLLQVIGGRQGAFRRDTLLAFIARDARVAGSSRALGWDTMLPTSSCGTRMSPRSFGHTGFTGTSLWIDPDREIYVVLLTNRVYPSRDNDQIRRVRPAFHDAVIAALDEGK